MTTRCTARCAVCPRSALTDRWLEVDLSDAAWARLAPDLSLAEHVHLQGWGEPLLHPGLRRMVRAARRAGCSVGLTTNGELLERADWLLQERVGIVTVSVAGEPQTHARLRDGSRLERVLEAAGRLAREAGRRARIQLSYLLTRDNAADLPALVERAARAGVPEVFVTHLDSTPTPDLVARSALDEDGLAPGVEAALDEAEVAARRHRLRFRGPSRQPQELLTCALDPGHFAFVAADGRVGPCVNLLLPVDGPLPRPTRRERTEVAQVRFGSLERASLREILAGPERQGFTQSFSRRLAAERRFLESVTADFGAEALRQLEAASQTRDRALTSSPFPPACAGCHKRLWA